MWLGIQLFLHWCHQMHLGLREGKYNEKEGECMVLRITLLLAHLLLLERSNRNDALARKTDETGSSMDKPFLIVPLEISLP